MEQKNVKELIYAKLPASTRNVILGPGAGEDTEFNVVKFVQNLLPSTLKQDFTETDAKKFRLAWKYRKACTRRFKKSLLSAKERQQLGLYNLRRQDMKYKDFLPLHRLWKEYFIDYMELSTLEKQGFVCESGNKHWENVTRKLLKADYHGCVVTVSRSLCPSLVGKQGIVVLDTKNTFQILCKDDVLKIVPKASSIFKLSVNNYSFTILGNQFCIKPTARSSKRMKNVIKVEL